SSSRRSRPTSATRPSSASSSPPTSWTRSARCPSRPRSPRSRSVSATPGWTSSPSSTTTGASSAPSRRATSSGGAASDADLCYESRVLPYIHLPELNLGPIPIHWFGILVATGVLIGIWITRRRAKFMGVDPIKLESLINWMLLCGFVLSHVLDSIFYHPDELVRRPWSILFVWEGLSSFGRFVGALTGIFLWKHYKSRFDPLTHPPKGKGSPKKVAAPVAPEKPSLLPYADLVLSAFPVAWIFGRMGCSVVHDHKGHAAPASC